MKIRLQRDTVVAAGRFGQAGDQLELDDSTARLLVRLGAAEPVTAPPTPQPQPELQPAPMPVAPVAPAMPVAPITVPPTAPSTVEPVEKSTSDAGEPQPEASDPLERMSWKELRDLAQGLGVETFRVRKPALIELIHKKQKG